MKLKSIYFKSINLKNLLCLHDLGALLAANGAPEQHPGFHPISHHQTSIHGCWAYSNLFTRFSARVAKEKYEKELFYCGSFWEKKNNFCK